MLIECKDCGGKVSDDADTCIHCGYRMRGRQLLEQCQHCGETVLPELYPHDPISLYCPLCNKPMSRIALRYGIKAFWILFFAGLIIGAIWAANLVLEFLQP